MGGGTGTELEAHTLACTSVRPRSRLYQRTDKGVAGTELEENTLAGTSGLPCSRLYRKTIKGAAGTELGENTHLPVLAGVAETDFIKKPIKGAPVPQSRKTH